MQTVLPLLTKKFVKVKTCNSPVVKINTKSSPPNISYEVVIQNEKKRRVFSANIGSLELRMNNTFWGKSDCSSLHS